MIRPDFRSELLGQRRKFRKIWWAFAHSVLIFLGMPHLLPSFLSEEFRYGEKLRAILWILSIGEMVLLAWWKKRYLDKESILSEAARNQRLKPLPGISASQSALEEGAAKTVSWWWIVKLTAIAIAQSLALYGLILAFLGRYFTDQYLLSLVSGVLLVREFPSEESFEQLLKEYEARNLS
jgi:hypothetical protein